MTLTNPRLSQIDTSDIDSTEFASETQTNSVQSNLDAFASTANSTFSTGPSFEAGQLLDSPIQYTNSSNVVSLSTSVTSKDNLLVYLDGLLQHPDTYVLSGDSIQFANVEPIPANVSVGIRYLATPSTLIANTATANTTISANGSILWDYESKRIYVYNGVTEGGFYANATQAAGYSFQGSVSGYTSGGQTPTVVNTIDKFPFSTDGNASDVGDLTAAIRRAAGQSSTTSGYNSGGNYPVAVNTIDKFPFAVDGNATDVGDLTQARDYVTGQSSTTSGYTSGGATVVTIDKFPFSADANASDVGDLTQARYASAGQSSSESGYTSGGSNPDRNTIDKVSFTADGNAADVGDLTIARSYIAGQSSTESGYTSGGNPLQNTIDKFPFATDANASDVGDITQSRYGPAGQSSIASGYTSGGFGTAYSNVIDKFPFATASNASDVGDLTLTPLHAAGQQR